MVNLHFPHALTEEEEQLKLKYAKLRKKKKALQALKNVKPETKTQVEARTQAVKRPAESAGEALQQAKKLVQSGAIQIRTDKREHSGFKRAIHPEKKSKDSEKPVVGFQPFSATHPEEEERSKNVNHSKIKGGYNRFVSGGYRHDHDGERSDGREPPRRGQTIYVRGHRMTQDILQKAASHFGTILKVTMEQDRNCGFVTFEKVENAEQAISELNGSMFDNIQLQVSLAINQPVIEPVEDNLTSGWSSIAANESQKGSGYKDRRDMVAYDDDIFGK